MTHTCCLAGDFFSELTALTWNSVEVCAGKLGVTLSRLSQGQVWQVENWPVFNITISIILTTIDTRYVIEQFYKFSIIGFNIFLQNPKSPIIGGVWLQIMLALGPIYEVKLLLRKYLDCGSKKTVLSPHTYRKRRSPVIWLSGLKKKFLKS